MKQFRYTLNPTLCELFANTVKDGYDGSGELYGYMPDTLKDSHAALYCVCSLDNTDDGKNIYSNPIAVVERTNSQAINVFTEITGLNDGTVLCILEEKIANIKVRV